MSALPFIRDIFHYLTRGCHLSHENEPMFSALLADPVAYADYFRPLGFELVRHEREFFYFAPEDPSKVPDTLPRIAVFSYILIDHAANQGQIVEDFLLGNNFLLSALPHFSLERYAALLRQVDVHELADVNRILDQMERLGWSKWLGPDEFRLLRPFHRVFDKCLELVQQLQPAQHDAVPSESPPS